MKPLLASQGIIPLDDFKSHASRILYRLNQDDQPVLITENGRPAGVLISPAEFDRMQKHQQFLDDVGAGIAELDAGQFYETSQVKEILAAHRKQRSESQ